MTAQSEQPTSDQPPPQLRSEGRESTVVIVAAATVIVALTALAGIWYGGGLEPSPSFSADPTYGSATPAPEATLMEVPRTSIGSGIGVDWTTVATFPGAGVADMTAGGPGFVAVGASPPGCEICPGLEAFTSRIWTSIDGLQWTDVAVPGLAESRLYRVAATSDRLVAFGERDANPTAEEEELVRQFLVSTDGLTWSRSDVGGEYSTQLSDLVGGSMFVAVGSLVEPDYDPRGAIWTSTDGRDWQEVFRSTDESWIQSVTPTDDGWVAVGGAIRPPEVIPTATCSPGSDCGEPINVLVPLVWTSTDGLSWTQSELPPGLSAIGGSAGTVLATHLGLIATGYAVYPGDEYQIQGFAAWQSVDGLTWQPATVTTDFLENIGGGLLLYESDERVFAIGSSCICGSRAPGRWWTTTNGLDWVQHTEPPPILGSVIQIEGGLLATGGDAGAILTSP